MDFQFEIQEGETLMRPSFVRLSLFSLMALLVTQAGAESPKAKVKTYTKADVERLMFKELSNWGRWGKNDQLGTLNLITKKKRLEAVKQVGEGHSVSMARDTIKVQMDGSKPFQHKVLLGRPQGDIGSAGDFIGVEYHGFTQTHMDGLCHLFYKGKMYNGYSSKLVTEKGAAKLGIQQFKRGVMTRAILMDMPQLFGVRFLKGKRAIYPRDLEAWEKKAGVKVGSGDAVLINTGRWLRRKTDGPWEIMQNSAGLHISCTRWLKKRDVAIVGSDLALDVMPSGVKGFELPVHWTVVVGMGMPILDNCDFGPVSKACRKRKRWSFLLTVSPLAVPGGTGSPVNPIATF